MNKVDISSIKSWNKRIDEAEKAVNDNRRRINFLDSEAVNLEQRLVTTQNNIEKARSEFNESVSEKQMLVREFKEDVNRQLGEIYGTNGQEDTKASQKEEASS